MNRQPWEQSGLGLDEDFVEGIDDELSELGIDYHSAPVEDVAASQAGSASADSSAGSAAHNASGRHVKTRRLGPGIVPPGARTSGKPRKQRKYRIRPMGEALTRKFAGVDSILITRTDGSQVLLVRKG